LPVVVEVVDVDLDSMKQEAVVLVDIWPMWPISHKA
jgi:hypothetical protein